MKRIIITLVIMLSMVSVSFCQYEEDFKDKDRKVIHIGDYGFFRNPFCLFNHGKILYNIEYIDFEEAMALKNHIERNKSYYEEKFNCQIVECTWLKCLSLTVIYKDWEEKYNNEQAELANKIKTEREKRLESINW